MFVRRVTVQFVLHLCLLADQRQLCLIVWAKFGFSYELKPSLLWHMFGKWTYVEQCLVSVDLLFPGELEAAIAAVVEVQQSRATRGRGWVSDAAYKERLKEKKNCVEEVGRMVAGAGEEAVRTAEEEVTTIMVSMDVLILSMPSNLEVIRAFYRGLGIGREGPHPFDSLRALGHCALPVPGF